MGELIKLRVDRSRLQAKIFGGSEIIPGQSDTVGKNNIRFIKAFLEMEGIPIVSSDLGGKTARKIFFFPHNGKVMVKRITQNVNKIVGIEDKYQQKAKIGTVKMFTNRKIKLLIVDDSILIRTFLKELFASQQDFEIIGTASNPYQARDIMRRNWPDVITLDVEMPRMNGIDFLRKIMRSRPTPVVMISTLTKDRAAITLEALEIGAVDYFPKPEGGSWKALGIIKEDVLKKVRNASRSNIRKRGLMQESAFRNLHCR